MHLLDRGIWRGSASSQPDDFKPKQYLCIQAMLILHVKERHSTQFRLVAELSGIVGILAANDHQRLHDIEQLLYSLLPLAGRRADGVDDFDFLPWIRSPHFCTDLIKQPGRGCALRNDPDSPVAKNLNIIRGLYHCVIL